MAMAKWLTNKLGGAFNQTDNLDSLSNGAAKLIEDALVGFETNSPIIDYNVNLVGTGTSNTGCYVHSNVYGSVWKHPVANMKIKLLESASGIKDPLKWDETFIHRLIELRTAITRTHGAVWGAQSIHSLDQFHDKAGAPVPENTASYVPNDYVFQVLNENPGHFVPCVSIHPYRRDAIQELRKWVKKGVRMIKWIPSVQGIDPSNERCDNFYKEMARHDLILHCGGERVLIDPPGFNLSLENPLLLRRPLAFGVKVIVSHCATEGKSIDIEFPPHSTVENLQLFLRMMEDSKYVGLLFGDISGICNFSRVECLQQLLDNTELHKRLVYGSDYPIPAINLVVQTYWFGNKGLVTEKECDYIGEIYKTNPLLFDFVVKRTLKSKSGNKFNISIFKEHPDLQITKLVPKENVSDEGDNQEEEERIEISKVTPSPAVPHKNEERDNTNNLTINMNNLSVSSNNKLPVPRPVSPAVFVPSPKFSITTPPSPAVRTEINRLEEPDYEEEHIDLGEDEEGFTEEVNLTD